MNRQEAISGGEEFSNRQAAIRFEEMQRDTMRLSTLGLTKTVINTFQKISPGLIVPDSPLYLRMHRVYKDSNNEDTTAVISMTFQLHGLPWYTSWPLEPYDGKLLLGGEEITLTAQQRDEIENTAKRRPPQSLMEFDHVVAYPFLPHASQ